VKSYLVVRQASNTTEPNAYYVYAEDKQAIKDFMIDWDSDTPEITYTTLIIKRLKD
jgi:hypothetical protein